jgi:hypothetical protein
LIWLDFSGKLVMERDDDHFDLDDDFVAESDEDSNYEKFIDSGARRARPNANAAAKKVKQPGANSRMSWPTGA